MDIEKLRKSFINNNNGEKKYPSKKIIALCLVAVIILLSSSFVNFDNSDKVNDSYKEYEALEYIKEQERKLEAVLEKINGAGEVYVYITIEGEGEKVLARDSKNKLSKDGTNVTGKSIGADEDGKAYTKYDEESESQVVSGSKSGGEPYVVQHKVPKIDGVLVVAQGAAKERVKMEIYDAVKAVFGIGANRIKVTY